MPARSFSSSPAMCRDDPMPAEPKVSCPGRALAIATSSARFFTPRFGATEMICGTASTWVIGVRSRSGS